MEKGFYISNIVDFIQNFTFLQLNLQEQFDLCIKNFIMLLNIFYRNYFTIHIPVMREYFLCSLASNRKKEGTQRTLSVYFICIFISNNINVFFTVILLGLGGQGKNGQIRLILWFHRQIKSKVVRILRSVLVSVQSALGINSDSSWQSPGHLRQVI